MIVKAQRDGNNQSILPLVWRSSYQAYSTLNSYILVHLALNTRVING